MDAAQEERARVATILHDQVGQVMSAVGLQLELLRMDFEHGTPEIAARTEEIQKLLERALTHVRSLVSELKSSASTARAPGPQKTGRLEAD